MRALIATATAMLVVGCSGGGSGARTNTGAYIAIGDSITAGNGASDRATTSYVADVARDKGIGDVRNLAVAGATTQDVIDKQLPPAIEAMKDADVAFITISVGGFDLAALIPNATCLQDPLPESCPLDQALSKVEANLDTIVRGLRGTNGDVPIVLLLYPNFFSGTGHAFDAPAARVLPRLDEVIGRVAKRFEHTAVAAAAPAFEGNGGRLTHVLDAQFDPHPNDAGHRAIADAFDEALERVN